MCSHQPVPDARPPTIERGLTHRATLAKHVVGKKQRRRRRKKRLSLLAGLRVPNCEGAVVGSLLGRHSPNSKSPALLSPWLAIRKGSKPSIHSSNQGESHSRSEVQRRRVPK